MQRGAAQCGNAWPHVDDLVAAAAGEDVPLGRVPRDRGDDGACDSAEQREQQAVGLGHDRAEERHAEKGAREHDRDDEDGPQEVLSADEKQEPEQQQDARGHQARDR